MNTQNSRLSQGAVLMAIGSLAFMAMRWCSSFATSRAVASSWAWGPSTASPGTI